MVVEIKIDFGSQFEKIANGNWNNLIDLALQKSIAEAESICIREAPVKTGTLRRSIGTGHPSKGTVYLNGVKYWRHVQYGTGPHEITPKSAKLLHWKDDKGEHFAKKVYHPGTKANPFVTRAAKKIQNDQVIQRNMYDVLKMNGII